MPAAGTFKDLRSAGGRRLKHGVGAKDIILNLISRIGIGGGTGCVFEYSGSAIRALSMEERMTICNMSIEGGARAGMIAPDDTTYRVFGGTPVCAQRVPTGTRQSRVAQAAD